MRISLSFLISIILLGCTEKTFNDIIIQDQKVVYSPDIDQIMQDNCVACHNSNINNAGVVLDSYLNVKLNTEAGNLITAIQTDMPPGGLLSDSLRDKILNWHANGCPEN